MVVVAIVVVRSGAKHNTKPEEDEYIDHNYDTKHEAERITQQYEYTKDELASPLRITNIMRRGGLRTLGPQLNLPLQCAKR